MDSPLYLIDDLGLRINGFIRYGIADDRFNPIERYLGAGVVATGLVASRPDDSLGVAIARAKVGDPMRQAHAAQGLASDSSELNFELTYSAQLTDWLRVRPNIQYIINPGADPTLNDALVIGL